MTSRFIAIIRGLNISRVTNSSFNIKFSHYVVIVKYSTANMFLVSITNKGWFLVSKINRNRRDNRFVFR